MATAIRLYQRLDSTQGYRLVRVKYSRNGSPVADPHATTFYLRYRKNGKRHCIPAGGNVLEAANHRKVLEARLANGEELATSLPANPARKRLADEAAEYIERSKQKSRKTHTGDMAGTQR